MTDSRTKRRSTGGGGDSKPGSYQCDYCRKDITNCIRIRCADCLDFGLCVECFSLGAEIPPHKKWHSYRVIGRLHFPVFEEDWNADEEDRLLEALEIYGLGSWQDVADHVGTKTAVKAKKHYYDVFVNVPTRPRPDMTKQFAIRKEDGAIELLPVPKSEKSDDKERDDTSTKDDTPSENTRQMDNYKLAEVAGFMPKREEFETEVFNDAEMSIHDMENFSDGEADPDRELKLQVLQAYCRRLDERDVRRRFVLQRGLLDLKARTAQERKRPKEDREVYNRMRVFARFQAMEDHERFVGGLIEEMHIRRRIEQLKEFRRQGITTLAEAETFEKEKALRRDTDALSRKSKESSYLSSTRSRTRLASRGKDKKSRLLLPLDLSGFPGVEMLSAKEKELCSALRMSPRQFIAAKDILIRESCRLGYVTPSNATQLVKVDTRKAGKIYEYLVRSGWVTGKADATVSGKAPPGHSLQPASSVYSLNDASPSNRATESSDKRLELGRFWGA